jgi:hypothetical protein
MGSNKCTESIIPKKQRTEKMKEREKQRRATEILGRKKQNKA